MANVTMNGKFAIKSAQFPAYALNVYADYISSGKNVCLYTYSSDDLMQQWIPQAQGNNVYKLSTANLNSCRVVLDRYRVDPVNNCDLYTTGRSLDNGEISADLLDQQVQFDEGSDGYFTIYLYENGARSKVLTCASTADGKGVGAPSTLNVKNNVYWAAKSSSLGKRQKWTVVQLAAKPSDTILKHAQPYVQRDDTWAYLTTPTEFDMLGCGVCALTTCGAILNGDDSITPQTCRDDGGFYYGNVTAIWTVYDISTDATHSNDPENGYKKIHSEISEKRPVIVRVRKPGFDHFVTAYGYTSGTTEKNVTPSRILIIDPYNPEFTNLQELLNHCGSNGGYLFIRIAELDK